MTVADATQPKSRRWLRFNLRALFVLITLVACVAAWLGMQIARHHREEVAIAHLIHGGTTSMYWASRFDQPASSELNPLMPMLQVAKTDWADRLRNLEMFRTVIMFQTFPAGNTFSYDADDAGRLVIHREFKAGLKDDDMAWVAKLVNLRSLWLEANGITDKGLIQLIDLKHLEILWLQNTAISDDGISSLPKLPKLRDLDLSATDVTDASIAALSQCRALQHLKLNNTNVTEKGITTLQRSLPDCVITK